MDTLLIWSNLCALKLNKNQSNKFSFQLISCTRVLCAVTFCAVSRFILFFSGHFLGKVCGAPTLFCVSSISCVFWYFYDNVRPRTKVVPCCHVHLSPEFCFAQCSFDPDETPRDLVLGDYEFHVLLVT